MTEIEGNFDVSAAVLRAAKLRKDGLTPIAIIKGLREEFGMGLKDAKRIMHYALSPEEQAAHDKMMSDLCDELEKEIDK